MLTLNDIKNYLEIFKLGEAITVLERAGSHEFTYILLLECEYTFSEIEKFISNHEGSEELSESAINDLIDIFAKRWERIKDANCSYVCDMTHPANLLLLNIAKGLQPIVKRSAYTLLMPTLNSFNDDLKPTEVVLTDDHSDFIEVFACLKHYALTGNFLRTNPDESGERLPLTATEIFRVYDHSNESIQFHDVITKLKEMKKNLGALGKKELINAADDLENKYRNITDDFVTFVYSFEENENKVFASIIADKNSHYLLTQFNLMGLYHELNSHNQHELVIALLGLGNPGSDFIKREIKRFNQLIEVMSTLNEQEKLLLLSQTGILNNLLDTKGKMPKSAITKTFVAFLNKFENKKAVLATLSPEILNFYNSVAEIKQVLDEEEKNREVSEDAMDLDAEDDSPTLSMEDVLNKEIQLSLLLSEEEMASFPALSETTAESNPTEQPTVAEKPSLKRKRTEEPVIEQEKSIEPDAHADETTLATALTDLPPPKRRRLDSPADQASAPSIESPLLLGAPVISQPLLASTSQPSPSLQSTPTLFQSGESAVNSFIGLYQKAKKGIDNQEPLEALYYIKRSYDLLLTGNVANPLWKANQIKRLNELAKEAVNVFNDRTRWIACFNHYKTCKNNSFVPTWIEYARKIANELFRNDDKPLIILLNIFLDVLERHHPKAEMAIKPSKY